MSEPNSISTQTVLIVDDEPENIRILIRALKSMCVTTAATDGSSALEIVFSINRPDLILLDIMMPGMNGYEVCERLKENSDTSDIPVIFITALSDSFDEARGFEAGAADYITKPFKPDIVQARVATHLELKKHQDHLLTLAEQRAKQMIHMERLASLGTLGAGLVHEINNGLSTIIGPLTILEDCLIQVRHTFPGSASLIEKSMQYLGYMKQGVDRINSIARSMNRFSRRDDGQKGDFLCEDCIQEALTLCHNKLKKNIEVSKHVEPKNLTAYVDKRQLEQVLINLFINAADAMSSVKKGLLDITAYHGQSIVRIIVEDNGPGIPEDKLENIWEPFFTTKNQYNGTGLGLSICKGIIEDHGGNIRAENRAEGGARFIIELPLSSSGDLPSQKKFETSLS